MLLSSPKARLIALSETRLIKFYLNSELMTDPIYPIPLHFLYLREMQLLKYCEKKGKYF